MGLQSVSIGSIVALSSQNRRPGVEARPAVGAAAPITPLQALFCVCGIVLWRLCAGDLRVCRVPIAPVFHTCVQPPPYSCGSERRWLPSRNRSYAHGAFTRPQSVFSPACPCLAILGEAVIVNRVTGTSASRTRLLALVDMAYAVSVVSASERQAVIGGAK